MRRFINYAIRQYISLPIRHEYQLQLGDEEQIDSRLLKMAIYLTIPQGGEEIWKSGMDVEEGLDKILKTHFVTACEPTNDSKNSESVMITGYAPLDQTSEELPLFYMESLCCVSNQIVMEKEFLWVTLIMPYIGKLYKCEKVEKIKDYTERLKAIYGFETINLNNTDIEDLQKKYQKKYNLSYQLADTKDKTGFLVMGTLMCK